MIEEVFATMLAGDTLAMPARGIADLAGIDTNGNVRVFLDHQPYNADQIASDDEWTVVVYEIIDETSQFHANPGDDIVQITFWSKDAVRLRQLAERARVLLTEQEAAMNEMLTDRRIDSCVEQLRVPTYDQDLKVPGIVVQYRVLSYEL